MRARAIQLNHAITIPGTNILGAISILPEKHPKAVMMVGDHGVTVESHDITFFIPMSNIHSIILAPEVVSESIRETKNGRSK